MALANWPSKDIGFASSQGCGAADGQKDAARSAIVHALTMRRAGRTCRERLAAVSQTYFVHQWLTPGPDGLALVRGVNCTHLTKSRPASRCNTECSIRVPVHAIHIPSASSRCSTRGITHRLVKACFPGCGCVRASQAAGCNLGSAECTQEPHGCIIHTQQDLRSPETAFYVAARAQRRLPEQVPDTRCA